MARKKRWKHISFHKSVQVYELTAWKYFNDFICDIMLEHPNYIWRGQASSKWKLIPTLDRALSKLKISDNSKIRMDHLEKFRYSIRGRRGLNPSAIVNENDLWALAQHYGLNTPLLDWTISPYVAAFFAFAEHRSYNLDFRSIYAISRHFVEIECQKIKSNWRGTGRAPIIEFINPLSDENIRLVNQGGIFTRGVDGIDLEKWIQSNSNDKTFFWLLKLNIPNSERKVCLKSLNRMNINYLSLFPDLTGSSKHCNLSLEIDKY